MTKTSLHFQEFAMGGKIFHFWMADDSKFGFKIVISGIFYSQKPQNIARSFPVNQNSCQDGPKFEIVLYARYVAQNLQNCVLILTIFSESKSKQNCGCYVTKTSLHFQECSMLARFFHFRMADSLKSAGLCGQDFTK